MKLKLFYFIFICQYICVAQVGIGTTTPNPSAALDIYSTTKGVLIPRLAQSERVLIITPAQGLLVYQIDATQGFYYFDGSIWNYLSTATLDAWSKTGNAATDATVHFLGTTDDEDLVLRTNNLEHVRVHTSGNVAIGTTNDEARLTTNIDVANLTTDYGMRNIHNGGTGNTKYGMYNNVSADGLGGRYGIYNIARQNSASNELAYGTFNNLTSYGTAKSYGLYNYHFAIGEGESYGIANVLNLTNPVTSDVYLNYHFLLILTSQ